MKYFGGKGSMSGKILEYFPKSSEFDTYIEVYGGGASILFALEKIGEINIKQGNFTQALQNFNQLLQINPNDAKAYFNRGKVYEALNMPEQALKDYDIGASFNNNSPESEQKTLPENKLDPKINSNSI